ncbi:MATE family efflux transporter [Desulfosporosinus meridiei]|uniref:Multidrug export protein MepA n=1 Tax=Desulfosporosinus meridiei (strain ATCC BAA-275 / DSM 13257 / KCTC 12902 / NCIMB 13706 / S10) TaxID=768704 RepID=J7IPY8_DESMD|nr:MATE family efflux transporter [Desulfosporosinus meridiei]AFQ43907.1 putative efflux protein, MATE family [Desulfosporosinus meridiei DSM 13257]
MGNNNNTLITMPVSRLLLKFSLPAIGGMIINSLYNLVDRIFVGRIGGLAMTGIGLSLPFMMMLFAVSSLVGIGASALISIKLGENNKDEAKGLLGNAITLLIGLMLLMTLLGLIFMTPILETFGASEATMPYAVDYMTVILYGAVFQGIGTGLLNVVRATGHPVKSMVIVLVGTLINIILDPILIFTFDMGIAGAAWATIIAQLVTSIMVIQHFISEKSPMKIEMSKLKLHLVTIKSILSIGFAPFIMQLSSVVVSIISNNALKTHGGDVAIGAMTIINSVMVLFLMSAMGVTQGAAPIIGFNYGAKHFDRVKQILKLELLAVSSIFTITFIVVQAFPVMLSSIFTNEPDLISKASSGMRLFLLMLPLLSAQIVGANYFQAIGEAKKASFLGLSRQVLFLIPLLLILPNFLGLNGVWGAGALSDLISSLIAIMALRSAFNHLNKLENEHRSEEPRFLSIAAK